MFDLSWGKLVIIGVIALVVIGPKELPAVLRTLGQYMGKIRRMASEFQGQFQEALREAELHELKKEADALTSSVADMSNFDPMAEETKQLEDTQQQIESSLTAPEPAAAEPAAEPALPPVETTAAIEAQPLPVQPAPAEAEVAEPPRKAAGGTA